MTKGSLFGVNILYKMIKVKKSPFIIYHSIPAVYHFLFLILEFINTFEATN